MKIYTNLPQFGIKHWCIWKSCPLWPIEELVKTLGGETLVIDVTERAHRRPQEAQKQHEHYSGKKKYTVKNTVFSTLNKVIVFLGQTIAGSHHDYAMSKKEEF